MSHPENKYFLPDVTIRKCQDVRRVVKPAWSGSGMLVSQNEFLLEAEGTGQFYARDGREVDYSIVPDADDGWVQLYLNGQILVALLHQRKIISFHASSFVHEGKGVMVLGGTGAGKSSLTVSFVLNGAGFLTDDLSSVIFRDGKPHIRPFHRDVKLRHDTVLQLGVAQQELRDAERGTGKQYLKLDSAGVEVFPLNVIMFIETGDCFLPEFHKLSAADKFSMLRSEVCSWEILAGMPETERAYLEQLVNIIEQVDFVRVVRPVEIAIAEMHEAVENFLRRL